MPNVLVYRVEDRNGIGPFQSELLGESACFQLRSHMGGLPTPRSEGFRLIPDSSLFDNLICGCGSLEDLQSWIPYDVVDDLDSLGFRLITYSIEFDPLAIEIKQSQTVFNRNLATKVGSSPVYEIYSY